LILVKKNQECFFFLHTNSLISHKRNRFSKKIKNIFAELTKKYLPLSKN
jgi:hypothetical protein